MPTTVLITLTTSSSATSPEHVIDSLSKALAPFKQTTTFTIGTKTPDQNIYQITSSWPSATPTSLPSSPSFLAFKSAIESAIPLASDPETLFTSLDTHSSNGDQAFDFTTPPLIEWVITSFPASSATPSFKASIEADFARFEESYRAREKGRVSPGEVGLATGWAAERDGETRFVVARGWEGMRGFEEATETEVFKESIGILLGWGAGFEMRFVERRG